MSASAGQALEAAILANPDDLGAHAAYADWLIEQGDPRGEFIQVQLALEDPKKAPAERKQLQKREQDLLEQHAPRWLGDLGRFLHGNWSGPDKPYAYQFVRGWLDMVRILSGVWDERVGQAILAALGRSPGARLLRRLEVLYDMRYHPFHFEPFLDGPNRAMTAAEKQESRASHLDPLIASAYLTNLRAFKLGFSDSGDRMGHSTMVPAFEDCMASQVVELLSKCPRLEELYLNTTLAGIDELFALPQLGNLRTLQYYFGNSYEGNNPNPYPLKALAQNASLSRLTHLRLHPGRDTTLELAELAAVLRSPHLPRLAHLQAHMTTFGDQGARTIVQSGILRRLKSLDIAYGNMSDAGARTLASCPDLKEFLDVSRNSLTEEGLAALQAVGIRVIAGDQHDAGEQDYLYEVDFE